MVRHSVIYEGTVYSPEIIQDFIRHVENDYQRDLKKALKLKTESLKKQRVAAARRRLVDRIKKKANQVNERFGWREKSGEIISQGEQENMRTYALKMAEYRKRIKALGYLNHLYGNHLERLARRFGKDYPEIFARLKAVTTVEEARQVQAFVLAEYGEKSELFKILRAVYIKGKLESGLPFEHYAYYAFNTAETVSKEISQQNYKKRVSKNELLKKINPAWVVKEATQFIRDNVTCKLQDVNTTELITGLALATGRRQTEIIKTATFKKVHLEDGSTSPDRLDFIGQLKTKNREALVALKPNRVYTIVPAELVIKGLNRLHRYLKEMDKDSKNHLVYINALGKQVKSPIMGVSKFDLDHNRAVTEKFAKPLRPFIKRWVGNDEFMFRDTRAVNVAVAYALDPIYGGGGSKTMDISLYRERHLGHQKDSSAEKYYASFKVDENVAAIEFGGGSSAAEPGSLEEQDKALLAWLEKRTDTVAQHVRAKAWPGIHAWFMEEVKNGRYKTSDALASAGRVHNKAGGKTSAVTTTVSYIRKGYEAANNISVNRKSVIGYLVERAEVDSHGQVNNRYPSGLALNTFSDAFYDEAISGPKAEESA